MFTISVLILMFLIPLITSLIVFGIPALIKFLREQD